MQRHINAELYDNNASHYMQLYLYDLAFAIEQKRIWNPQLNPVLLRQLTNMLHNCNSFIRIYALRATAKRIQLHIDLSSKNCMKLNPRKRLFLKIEADKQQSNLSVANEVVIIILDKYC